MCGRIAQFELKAYAKVLGVSVPALPPRFNIAPTSQVLACRVQGGRREALRMHWWLIPPWSTDPQAAHRYSTFNARVEHVATTRSFRGPWARGQRCIVPVDGFFEWDQERKRKLPYFVHRVDREPLLLAGLWETWERPGTAPIISCSILVGPPNAPIAKIHDRMPTLVRVDEVDRWLDPAEPSDQVLRHMRGLAPEELEAYRVDTAVNNARREGPELVIPLGTPLA